MSATFVQGTGQQSSGSVASVAKAFTANVTAGNSIIVQVVSSNTAWPTNGVTDNLGNTYVRDAQHTHAGAGAHCAIYRCHNATGGACTVTADCGTDFMSMAISEHSALNNAAPTNSANAGPVSSTAVSTGSLGAAASDGLLVGVMSHDGGTTTITPTFNQVFEAESGTNQPINAQYQVATAGTYSGTWTLGAAQTWHCCAAYYAQAAGGTANTISFSGSLTMSGALAKQGRKPLAGALTLAGALAKQAAKPLAGSLAMAGALAKRAAKPLAGGLTLAGAFTKQAGKALSGGLTLGGASIAKAVGKPLAGGLALGGALAKRTAKGLSGALTLSGAFAATRVILIAFAGTITLSGALTKRTGKSLSGALAMGGTLAKACAKGLSGSLTLSGSLAKQTAKGFAGAIALSGALAKRAGKVFAGGLSLAGSLSKLFTAGGGGGGGASAWYYRLTQWQWRRRR